MKTSARQAPVPTPNPFSDEREEEQAVYQPALVVAPRFRR